MLFEYSTVVDNSEGTMPQTGVHAGCGMQRPAIPRTIPQVSGQHSTGIKPTWYRVWYATNRALPRPADLAKGFAGTIDPQGATHYGQCWVAMPCSHQFGSLGTPSWKKWTRLQFDDDHLKLEGIRRFRDANLFLTEAGAELAARADKERHVLIYLRGDNVSFEQAALRSAQIGFDVKVPGLTAFFSWPSYETESGYLSDSDRIAVSENQIVNFLTDMASITASKRVHIIVHSTSSHERARALQRIVAQASVRSDRQFGHVIIATPVVIEVSRL